MANELEREIKRLSNLKNYKHLPSEELEPIACINLMVREFKASPLFDDDKEQKLAEDKFRNYLQNNEIESASDIDTLQSLIFNEIFEMRIQKELNELQKQSKIPSDKLIKSLVEVQNQKGVLKVKLGIDKKEEEDDLTAHQRLHKRVDKYIQDHKNEFTLYIPWTCKKCGYKDIESYLIYKRTENMRAVKHPWFIGRWLANPEIIKDVKKGKLTKQDAMRYLMSAGEDYGYKIADEDKQYCEDYINHLIDNWVEIEDLLKS